MILLLVVFIISLLATLWIIPRLIKGLKKHNMVVKDYYKKKETWIPSKGGMVLLFTCAFGITFIPILIYLSRQLIYNWIGFDMLNTPYLLYINYFIMLPLLAYGTFGMFDDYIDIGRPIKIFLPILFAAPLVLELDPVTLTFPFIGDIDLATKIFPSVAGLWIFYYRPIYRLIIIPVYITVCANLTNMHSGYNGLATGTSLIVLLTLIIKAFVDGNSGDIVSIGAFTGGLIALWIYNKYPSKIFEGNTGSLMIGAAIGITIVTKGYLLAGFICLIPHTVNFLLYVYWRIMRKFKPRDDRWKAIKWGKLREDGTLEVPNRLTVKWILPYYFKMTEKQAVWAMYALTGFFCLLGFLTPGNIPG